MTMAVYKSDIGQMLPVEITENGTFYAKEKHCRKNLTELTDAGAWLSMRVDQLSCLLHLARLQSYQKEKYC